MEHSLAEQLLAQLQGAPMQQISQQLGADERQTETAISAALPLLLGALGRNAAQPQGADALFGALQRDHLGSDPSSALAAALGGALGAGRNDGASILGHIFGGKQQRAEAGLGQATGLGGGNAAMLLQVLAPIVLSFLGQRVAQGGLSNPGALAQTLGYEAQQVGGPGGGLLSSLLDQDGDGQVDLTDLLKIGAGLLGPRR